jgi:uncharacterized protein YkwD
LKTTAYLLLALITGSSCYKNPSKSAGPSKAGTASHHAIASKKSYADREISISRMNTDIFNYVNAYRREKGLKPLQLLPVAATEAQRHSLNMATRRVPFGHAGFDHRATVIANQLNGSSSTGENVAYGKMTAFEVLTTWLKSAGHRENIEGPFTYTGIGVAKDSRGIVYYTQIFVKK